MTKSIRVFKIVALCLVSILLVALFRLQVLKGQHYQKVAESNFVRLRRVFATRGEIYDHKYRPIVQNVPAHDLFLISGKIRNLEALAKFLKAYFDISEEELKDLVLKQRFKSYEEILLADNIDYERVLVLSEKLNYYPELVFRIGSTRDYLYPNHFTGYIGRINEQEYERFKHEDYSLNGYIGKTGLERHYEVLLRGKDGREIVQVDAQGRSLELFRNEGFIEPVNGLSLVLSIDNDLQDFAMRAFPAGLRGAVVVSDVQSGGILAYVSKPDYDPTLFMQRISRSTWEELNRPEKPLLDRVIHATYPPGSVFKPITAGLGLESGKISIHTLLSACKGGMQVGNRFFKCWDASGHGRSSVIDALKLSCDTFFYDLSLKLGLDAFGEYARKCMMAVATGIDLPNERRGFFPDTAWYRKTFGQNVGIIGHKVNLSIGQGEILCSPIQMNAYFAALANDGLWIQPHLLKQTAGRGKLTREDLQKVEKIRLPLSAQNLKIIQDGLWAVCNAPGGTARSVQIPGAISYGKTGSAENSMGKKTHAWFCGYIKTDKPEIAVTVFMENAGGGGAMAAPVARQIFDYYMGNIDDIRAPAKVPRQFQDPDAPETIEDSEEPGEIDLSESPEPEAIQEATDD